MNGVKSLTNNLTILTYRLKACLDVVSHFNCGIFKSFNKTNTDLEIKIAVTFHDPRIGRFTVKHLRIVHSM